MAVKFTKPEINVREKLAELDKPSGIAGEAMLRAETPQEQFNLIGAGRRNLMFNGKLDVWQRGTSFTSAAGGYTADRFLHTNFSGATPNITKVTGYGEFRNAIRYTSIDGSGSDQIEVEQRFESTDLPQSGDLTLSYWIRGSKPGKIRTGRIINSGGTTNTGYDYREVNTEWSKITITVTAIAATVSQYYRLFILDGLLPYMTDDAVWLEITGIQLEIGKVATPFEHRPYGEELALCQRYYQHWNLPSYTRLAIGFVDINTRIMCTIPMPVQLRSLVSVGHNGLTLEGSAVSSFGFQLTNGALSGSINRSNTGLTVGQMAQAYAVGSGAYFFANGEL